MGAKKLQVSVVQMPRKQKGIVQILRLIHAYIFLTSSVVSKLVVNVNGKGGSYFKGTGFVTKSICLELQKVPIWFEHFVTAHMYE